MLDLSCGIRDLLAEAHEFLVCGMWNLVPWSEIKPGPPALEVGVLVTGPPGKSPGITFNPHHNLAKSLTSWSQGRVT